MGTHPDVLVVGGGVIGLTSAYLLAKSGLKVEVVDKGEMGREASWAGAGILPPWGDGEYATPLDRLRAYSVSRFAELSAELRELTGIDNEYHVCGGIEFLTEADADIPDLWRREGIRFERYTGPRPAGTVGYRLPFAQVRNPRHLKALIAGCRRLGVTLSPGTRLTEWSQTDRWHTARLHDGRWVDAPHYVMAAGAWADRTFGWVGSLESVYPVRGQMLLFNPGRRLVTNILIYGKRYAVPRLDGRILFGSTEEPDAGFDHSTTPEALSELIGFARSLVPALDGHNLERHWAGLRPGSRDGFPYIGRVPEECGDLYVAAGHFRAGIQTSIGTAECVRALVLGEPPPVPLDAFAVGREPHPPMRSAFRS